MQSFTHPSGTHRTWLPGLLAAAIFLLIGLAFVPYPGLQNDECLFVQPLYTPIAHDYKIRVFHHDQALMLMTYLGTVKTWIYAAIFAIWQPNVWTIRVPSLITGSLTIWMFTLLLKRVCGSFGAICGAFLLALDPSFLLTTVFDWGPVSFQHFFLVASLLAFHVFWKSESNWALAAGFLALGLAMWDKALFSWTLTGMGLAAILLFWRDLWRLWSFKRALLALASFVLGAWPLLLYNVRSQGETFRGNAKISTAEILPKLPLLWGTLDGYGLFGYLVFDGPDPAQLAPHNALEAAAARVRDLTGYHRQSSVHLALGLVLLALPLWRRYWKVVAFAGITSLVSWILMAATKGAGGSVHHVVLFWPMPQLMLAAGLAGIAENGKWLQRVAAALAIFLCLQNVLVLNQSFNNLFRDGEGDAWTDAINPLYAKLAERRPAHVNLMDWGFEYNLLALSGGTLPVRWGAFPGEHEVATAEDLQFLARLLEDPDSVWVRRKVPIEVTPGTLERFRTRALDQGYHEEPLDTIRDRNGRETFEIYRFVKGGT